MDLAEIAHVDVMHALLIVHRHLAVVRREADEIRVFDQVAAAIIEMNCECGELPTPGFSGDFELLSVRSEELVTSGQREN
jgi:hypothetical protein